MRKIENRKWTEKVPVQGKDDEGNEIVTGYEDKEVDLVTALGMLWHSVTNVPRYGLKEMVKEGKLTQEQEKIISSMPVGFEGAMFQNVMITAFTTAKATGELILEENEYEKLRNIVDNFIPVEWGGNKDIFDAVKSFMDAKKE